jgi:hypothetical protein
MSSSSLLRVLVAVPLAVLVVMLTVANLRTQGKLERLRDHGIWGTASIAPEQCSVKGESVYRFASNAQNYEGTGLCAVVCQTAPNPTSTPVLYDSHDPDNSVCEPLNQVVGRVQAFLTPLLVFGIATVAGIFWFTRGRVPRIVKVR